MNQFGLVDPICQTGSNQACTGAEHFKVKKPVHVRELGIDLLSTAIIYTLAHVSTSL